MSRAARARGRRRPVSAQKRPERAAVTGTGVEDRRVTLSRAAPSRGADLLIGARTFEVKARTRGLRQLYQWLGNCHFGVIVAAGTEEPLLVVRLGEFLRNCTFRESAQERRPKSPDSVCLPRGVSGPA